ncbi:hypothetical protein ACFQ2H_39285 [Streptomyces violaceoruber]
MTSSDHPLKASLDEPRAHLLDLIGAVEPWDDLEHTHLESARHWIAGGALSTGCASRTFRPCTW